MSEAAPDASGLPDEATQERVARNDAVFRDANEGISAYAADAVPEVARIGVPFLCECADTSCRDLVRLPLSAYEHVRSNPRWFLNVPGHEASAQGGVAVVERHDSYLVVEKLALGGRIAEELDPRRE